MLLTPETEPLTYKLDTSSPIAPDEPATEQEVYVAWYSLVEDYCSRVLTYPGKDNLAALSSIAKVFYERYQDIFGTNAAEDP